MRLSSVVPAACEVARCVAVLGAAEVLLRTVGLVRTCRCLRITLDVSSGSPLAAEQAVLPPARQRAVRAALHTVEWWPFGDTCLRRCIVLADRLRERAPVLRIGVTRRSDRTVLAHSWLEVDGRSVDGTGSDFAVLRSTGEY